MQYFDSKTFVTVLVALIVFAGLMWAYHYFMGPSVPAKSTPTAG